MPEGAILILSERLLAMACGVPPGGSLRTELIIMSKEVAVLEKAQEERESDIHLRVREGYDSAVADCWKRELKALQEDPITYMRDLISDNLEPTSQIDVPGVGECGVRANDIMHLVDDAIERGRQK